MKNDKNENWQKEDKPAIKQMIKYTIKKLLWLVNYSLSFSSKDSGKEIGIKILGCLVILHSLSILFFIITSILEIILLNSLFTLGLFLLILIFFFKKEVKQFLKFKGVKDKFLSLTRRKKEKA